MTDDEPYTDATRMPFGKHTGKPLHEVPVSYLKWLYGTRGFCFKHPKLHTYLAAREEELGLKK